MVRKLATLLAILILNYLPYWFGPKTHIRYIMPLYPLAALALAAAIWECGERPRVIAARWFIAAVVLRYAIGLWIFPSSAAASKELVVPKSIA